MNRNIKYIVVHCTATPTNTSVTAIKNYWENVKKWGKTPGYHFIVKRNGEIVKLQDIQKITNGVYGHNHEIISIAYIGGIDENKKSIDNRTEQQKEALFYKIIELAEQFPDAEILGHRDFPNVKKACPSFDVREWIKSYVPEVIVNWDKTDADDFSDLDDLENIDTDTIDDQYS